MSTDPNTYETFISRVLIPRDIPRSDLDKFSVDIPATSLSRGIDMLAVMQGDLSSYGSFVFMNDEDAVIFKLTYLAK
jgi:hypothetical protein